MFKKVIFFMVALCSLSACYVVANDDNGELEQLYGVSFEKQLVVQVKSTGCTKAEHFDVKVEQKGEHNVLSIMRIRPDRCRAMPKVIELALAFPDEAKAPFALANLFVVPAN